MRRDRAHLRLSDVLSEAADEPEVPLLGGDVTEGVVRVGSTVRRPLNPQSTAIHAYLQHLERAGFEAAPRFLGIDERGREMLTFIDGEIGGRPLQPWAVSEGVLVALARIQRRLHDCSVGFELPAGVAWQKPIAIEGVPPPFESPDIVGHNDLTPENVIFRAGVPCGMIDFDLAGPTTRLLDVTTTLLWWAPLRDPLDRDPLLRACDAGARMRLFADAYGLEADERARLLEVAERRFARSWHVMRFRAERDGGGWRRMWDAGVGDVIRRSEAWLARERPALERALSA